MRIIACFAMALFVLLSACSAQETGSTPPPPPPAPIEQPSPAQAMIEQAKKRAQARVEEQVAVELDAMRQYPIAYETPSVAVMGTPFNVTLAIDATGDSSAVEGLPGQEIIVESQALLSKDVEASLSGAAFEIIPTTSARQTLSPMRESVWRWSVTPLSAGDHNLFLELHALVGPDQTMLLESYSDLISVSVAPETNASNRADNIRTYVSIFGGLISILLGLIALNTHFKNRKKGTQSGEDG